MEHVLEFLENREKNFSYGDIVRKDIFPKQLTTNTLKTSKIQSYQTV